MEKDQNQRDALLNQQHDDPPPPYQQSVPVYAPTPAPILQPAFVPVYQSPAVPIYPVNYTKQDDYLCFSILNLICCSLCLGVPALIFSVKAREQFRQGRFDDGKNNASIAKKLNIAGFAIGISLIAFSILWFIFKLFIHGLFDD